MTNNGLTENEFRDAANHSIRAVLNLYTEVRSLFTELANALGDEEIAPFTNELLPRRGKGRYSDRVLDRYRGYLYRTDEGEDEAAADDEPDDEDDDAAPKRGRWITLPFGASLLFARAILYQPGRLDVVPILQYGVLTDARVSSDDYPRSKPLQLKRPQLRRVLYPIPERPDVGPMNQVVTLVPAPKHKKLRPRHRRLVLTLPEGPKAVPLYQIDSSDKVNEVAKDMVALWGRYGGE